MRCLCQSPPLWDQGTPWKGRWKECKGQRGWKTTRKQGLLNQHDQSSYELSETEVACEGRHRSVPCPLHMYYGFQFSVFYEIPECWNTWVSDPCAFSLALFLTFVCLVHFWCVRFCFILFLFLRSVFGERRWGKTESRGGETQTKIYYVRKIFFSMKEWNKEHRNQYLIKWSKM